LADLAISRAFQHPAMTSAPVLACEANSESASKKFMTS